MKRTPSRFLVLLMLIPVLVFGACGGGAKPFSSTEWKSRRDAGRKGSRTVALAESLIESRTLLGLNRTEVLDVLGEDDGATGRGRPGELEWVLEEGFLSCTVLRVNFGPDGRFVEAFTDYFTY